ncbi:hypothetical protein RO3G_05571 [Rhizopus delemar RA 99-880]|uniref:Uncharacterized protein n=3 Tax=Rhizopus TaxID=4842 RepID=I1BXD6_RHIO9|nr:hypothetical protein RO3G_05571 [Rhizopus delemar RA 99-880]|eukprot:EIE80866.1 hypothetical protein RO3G_05571 [Rhizopus delemar RA 99-880]
MASNSLSVDMFSNALNANDDGECSDPFNASTGLLKDPLPTSYIQLIREVFESTNRSIYASPVKGTEDFESSTSGDTIILTGLTQLTELRAELDITHDLIDTCSDEDVPDPSSIIKDTKGSSAFIDRRVLPSTLLGSQQENRNS